MTALGYPGQCDHSFLPIFSLSQQRSPGHRADSPPQQGHLLGVVRK